MASRHALGRAAYVVAGIAICGATVPAGAEVLYSTSGASVTGLGDQLGTVYDQFNLSPFTGTFTGSGAYEINPFTFVVGNNSYNPIVPVPALLLPTLSESFTIDGVTQTLYVPYSIVIDNADTLYVGTGPFPLTPPGYNATLFFPGYEVTIVPGAVGPIGTDPGGVTTFVGGLYAQITAVPEPSTWAMVVLGFAGIGFATLCRRRALAVG